MARLHPNFMFTGSMMNVSAYKMQGSDKIILRTKGGPSKSKIKRSPVFEEVRKNNMEFGGRAATTAQIFWTLKYMRPVADYNMAGPLISLLKPIQELDTDHEKGKRNVLLSRNPRLLEGFNLNRKSPFEHMILNPASWSLSKENFNAWVEFPALMPGINFRLPDGSYPVYRLQAVLGLIPDMFWGKHQYQPLPELNYHRIIKKTSDWFSVPAGSAVQKLEIQLTNVEKLKGMTAFSLMLVAGISFGKYNATGGVDPLKYVGCGKILAMD